MPSTITSARNPPSPSASSPTPPPVASVTESLASQARDADLATATAATPAPRRRWAILHRVLPHDRYAHLHPDDRKPFRGFVREARWLDGHRVCCGCCRFGVDSLVGLIPVIGDFAGAGLSVRLIGKAQAQWDLPSTLVNEMYRNVIVDTAIGFIPLVGDFLDITHRANIKNARLIEEHLRQVNATFNKSALRVRPDSGPLDHVADRAVSDDDSDSEDDDEAVTPAVRV